MCSASVLAASMCSAVLNASRLLGAIDFVAQVVAVHVCHCFQSDVFCGVLACHRLHICICCHSGLFSKSQVAEVKLVIGVLPVFLTTILYW